MLKFGLIVTSFVAVIGLAASAVAQAPGAKVGTLTCSMSPGVGMIIGGRQALACRFTPTVSHYAPDTYQGDITTVGLDLGATQGGTMVWAVFMGTDGPQHGALAGDYVGASGQVALGAGVGGNVLVGGSNRAVTLQPFSVEGDTGINLALGVSQMVLRPGP
jgi:Protein of unknown function (DUF992)